MFKARDSGASSSLEEFTSSLNAARVRLSKDREQCMKMQADIQDMDAALSRLETTKADLTEGIEGIDAECSRLSHVIDRRRAGVSAQKKELEDLYKPRVLEEAAASKATVEAASERSAFSAHACILSNQLLDDFIYTEPSDLESRIAEKLSTIASSEGRMALLQAELNNHIDFISNEERALETATVAQGSVVGEKRPRDGESTDDPQSSAPGTQWHRAECTEGRSLSLEVSTLETTLLTNRNLMEEDLRTLSSTRDALRVQLRTIDKAMNVADEAHESAQQRLVVAMDNTSSLSCTKCGGKVARDDIHAI